MNFESIVIALLLFTFAGSVIDCLFCERIKKKVASFEVELEILKRVNKTFDTK